MHTELTAAEKLSLTELFLRGVKAAGLPESLTPERLGAILSAGLDESHGFATEMLEQRTDRSKIAKRVLRNQVYGSSVARAAQEDSLRYAENLTGENFRRQVFGITV